MIGIKRGKVWGCTQPLFNKNNVEIHRIEAKKGGYCSTHLHRYKYNMFFVESGKISVTIYREDANKKIEDVSIISSGESTYVEPNVLHKFEAIEDTVAFEIYWTDLEPNDIERINVGGIENN